MKKLCGQHCYVQSAGVKNDMEVDGFSVAVCQEIGLEITELGKHVAMPWEQDGRQWHVHDRLDRKGAPVQWEGRVLAEVVDRIQAAEGFGETNWNSRSVVEIAGKLNGELIPTRSGGSAKWHPTQVQRIFKRVEAR